MVANEDVFGVRTCIQRELNNGHYEILNEDNVLTGANVGGGVSKHYQFVQHV